MASPSVYIFTLGVFGLIAFCVGAWERRYIKGYTKGYAHGSHDGVHKELKGDTDVAYQAKHMARGGSERDYFYDSFDVQEVRRLANKPGKHMDDEPDD